MPTQKQIPRGISGTERSGKSVKLTRSITGNKYFLSMRPVHIFRAHPGTWMPWLWMEIAPKPQGDSLGTRSDKVSAPLSSMSPCGEASHFPGLPSSWHWHPPLLNCELFSLWTQAVHDQLPPTERPWCLPYVCWLQGNQSWHLYIYWTRSCTHSLSLQSLQDKDKAKAKSSTWIVCNQRAFLLSQSSLFLL